MSHTLTERLGPEQRAIRRARTEAKQRQARAAERAADRYVMRIIESCDLSDLDALPDYY